MSNRWRTGRKLKHHARASSVVRLYNRKRYDSSDRELKGLKSDQLTRQLLARFHDVYDCVGSQFGEVLLKLLHGAGEER